MTHILMNGGRVPEISDIQVVALYEPDAGKIVHVHTVTVFKGGREVSEKEAIDTAVAHASKAGLRTERLKIKVSKDADHGRRPHRIDLSTGDFIPLPLKSRNRYHPAG
jgi:hypothetical protein